MTMMMTMTTSKLKERMMLNVMKLLSSLTKQNQSLIMLNERPVKYPTSNNCCIVTLVISTVAYIISIA